MDELIKRLKKTLSDFTGKLTDREGFIQQGRPTLQPIKQAITNWASQPQNYQTANTLVDLPQNYLNTYQKVQNFVPFMPKVYTPKQMGEGLNTWKKWGEKTYIEPAKQIISPKSSLLERGLGILQTGFNVLAPQTALAWNLGFSGWEGLKKGIEEAKKGKDFEKGFKKGFTGEERVDVGGLVTKDPTLRTALNIGEFAAPFFIGRTKKPDENVKMVSRAVKEGKITLEEGQAILSDMLRGSKGKIKIKGKTTPLSEKIPVGESGGEVGRIKIKGFGKPQDEFLKGLEDDLEKIVKQSKEEVKTKPENLNVKQAFEKASLRTALDFNSFKNRLIEALNNINALKEEGIKTGLRFLNIPENVKTEDVIKFIESPKKAPKILKPYLEEVRKTYDELYQLAKKEGINMNYVKNYITHIWDRPQEEVAQLYSQFKTRFKFQNERVLPNYEEGIKMGLRPKYTNPAQIIANYTARLKETIEKIRLLKDLEKEGFLVAKNVPGFEPVTLSGIQPKAKIIGENKIREGVYYAPPEVASLSRRAFSNEKGLFSLPAKIMSFWQDIKLAGGIPGTPINAWTFGQIIKEVVSGRPIHAFKSLLISIDEGATNNFFKQNINNIIEMKKKGIDVSTTLDFDALAGTKNLFQIFKDKGLGGVWNSLVNDPTFKRFSSVLKVDFYTKVKNDLIAKGHDANLASDIATEATKNFYGVVNYGKMRLRDKTVQNLITTGFFAPKYRESIINLWLNSIKGLKNPLAPENIYNTRFLVGSLLTYLAYDKINIIFNDGRGMAENPPGTEDKVLIPVSKITGDENDKTVIGIPFLPSIATLPRAAYKAGLRVKEGDIKEAFGETVKTTASIGLKTIGEVLTNSDYFGKEIYSEEDNLPTATKKIASYLFSQAQHPYIAEILDPRHKNDPAYQRLSRMLELPLRFYTEKSLNAKYFFKFQDEVLKGLNQKEKAAYNSIPKIDEKDPQDPNRRILKYQIYLTYPNVFKVKQSIEIAMTQKLGKEIDPLYLVDYETAKKYMRYETLPEGSPERKAMNKAYPELKVLFEERAKYFQRNPFDKDGQTIATTQPQPSESVKKKMEEKQWSDPEVQDYLNALRVWQNTQRLKLGLPSIDKYGNIEGLRGGFGFGGSKKIRISLKPPKSKTISIRPRKVRMPKISIKPQKLSFKISTKAKKIKKPKIKMLTKK